jgi:hypothetical protein
MGWAWDGLASALTGLILSCARRGWAGHGQVMGWVGRGITCSWDGMGRGMGTAAQNMGWAWAVLGVVCV